MNTKKFFVATTLAVLVTVTATIQASVMQKGDSYSAPFILYSGNGQHSFWTQNVSGLYYMLCLDNCGLWNANHDSGMSSGWGTHTDQAGNCGWLVLQYDGNLVCYTSQGGSPVWSTNTSSYSSDDVIFNIQDDGNAVVYWDYYSSGSWIPVWSVY